MPGTHSLQEKSHPTSWPEFNKGRYSRAKQAAGSLQQSHAAHRWDNTIWALTLRPVLGALVLGPFLLWMLYSGMRKAFYAASDRWYGRKNDVRSQRERDYWTTQKLFGGRWSRLLLWNEAKRCIALFGSLLFAALQGVVIASAIDKMLGNFPPLHQALDGAFTGGVDVALEAAFGAIVAQVNYFLTWSFVKGLFTKGFFPAAKTGENRWWKLFGRVLATGMAMVAAVVMAVLTLYALKGSAILSALGCDAALVETLAWAGFATTSLVYTVFFSKDMIEFADSIFAHGSVWENLKKLFRRSSQDEDQAELQIRMVLTIPSKPPQDMQSLDMQSLVCFILDEVLTKDGKLKKQENVNAVMTAVDDQLNIALGDEPYSEEDPGIIFYARLKAIADTSKSTNNAEKIVELLQLLQETDGGDVLSQKYAQLMGEVNEDSWPTPKPAAIGIFLNSLAQAALTAGQAIWSLLGTVVSALGASAASAAACSIPNTEAPDRATPIKGLLPKNALSLLLVGLVITGTVFMAMTTNVDLTVHLPWISQQAAQVAVSLMAVGSVGFVMVGAWKLGQYITSGIRNYWNAGFVSGIKELLFADKHEGYAVYQDTNGQLYQRINGEFKLVGSDEGAKTTTDMTLVTRPTHLSALRILSNTITLAAMVLGIMTLAGVAVSMPAGLPIYLMIGCFAFRRVLAWMERAHQDTKMLTADLPLESVRPSGESETSAGLDPAAASLLRSLRPVDSDAMKLLYVDQGFLDERQFLEQRQRGKLGVYFAELCPQGKPVHLTFEDGVAQDDQIDVLHAVLHALRGQVSRLTVVGDSLIHCPMYWFRDSLEKQDDKSSFMLPANWSRWEDKVIAEFIKYNTGPYQPVPFVVDDSWTQVMLAALRVGARISHKGLTWTVRGHSDSKVQIRLGDDDACCAEMFVGDDKLLVTPVGGLPVSPPQPDDSGVMELRVDQGFLEQRQKQPEVVPDVPVSPLQPDDSGVTELRVNQAFLEEHRLYLNYYFSELRAQGKPVNVTFTARVAEDDQIDVLHALYGQVSMLTVAGGVPVMVKIMDQFNSLLNGKPEFAPTDWPTSWTDEDKADFIKHNTGPYQLVPFVVDDSWTQGMLNALRVGARISHEGGIWTVHEQEGSKVRIQRPEGESVCIAEIAKPGIALTTQPAPGQSLAASPVAFHNRGSTTGGTDPDLQSPVTGQPALGQSLAASPDTDDDEQERLQRFFSELNS